MDRGLDRHVSEIEGELWQQRLRITLCLVGADQRLNRKGVSEIVNARYSAFKIAHSGRLKQTTDHALKPRRTVGLHAAA